MMVSAICNQQTDERLLAIGQVASIGSSIAAILITLGTFTGRKWAHALVWMVVALRATRIMLPESALLLDSYVLLTAAVYCVAGSVAIIDRPQQTAAQLYWTCVLCLPLM